VGKKDSVHRSYIKTSRRGWKEKFQKGGLDFVRKQLNHLQTFAFSGEGKKKSGEKKKPRKGRKRKKREGGSKERDRTFWTENNLGGGELGAKGILRGQKQRQPSTEKSMRRAL